MCPHFERTFRFSLVRWCSVWRTDCDRSIKIWNVNSVSCLTTLYGHGSFACSLRVFQESTRLISGSTGREDESIKVWDLVGMSCLRSLKGHSNYVLSLEVISSDLFVSGSLDKTIKVWRIETGECVKTIQPHNDMVLCLEVYWLIRIFIIFFWCIFFLLI